MDQIGEFCPVFERPPVVETLISVQFKPLAGFRSAHFGLFWLECLPGKKWTLCEDAGLVPHELERFDSPILNLPPQKMDTIDSLGNRAVYRSEDGRNSVHLQPDRLIYSCVRKGDPRPSYRDIRAEFDPLFGRFQEFCDLHDFGQIQPDLWEVSYTNAVPKGELWDSPKDWHKVFPGLFQPKLPEVGGMLWSTFDGEWFFEMTNQSGRVRVKARKAIANQTNEVVLLLAIRARGPLSESGTTWCEGLDMGHRAAVRLFHDVASVEARAAWGYES